MLGIIFHFCTDVHFIYPVIIITGNGFISKGIDEIGPQDAAEFLFQDNVFPVLIRKDEFVIAHFAILLQLAENGNKWGDASPSGDKNTLPLVLDSSPDIVDPQTITNFQLAQLVGNTGMGMVIIDLDGEFQEIP